MTRDAGRRHCPNGPAPPTITTNRMLGLVVAADENLNTYRNSNAGQHCAVGRASSQLSEAELEPLFGSTADEEQVRREAPSEVVERRAVSSRSSWEAPGAAAGAGPTAAAAVAAAAAAAGGCAGAGSVRRRAAAAAAAPDAGDPWRLLRRRTDPLDAASLLMPLPRDYRDALSSLLWQPYDCRSDDDAAPALLASSASSSPSTSSSESSVAAAPLLALRRWPAAEAAALPSLAAGAAVGGGRGRDQLPFGCLQCCADSSRAACPRDMLVNVPAPPPQQATPSTVLAPSSSSSPPSQPESVSVVVNSGSFPVVNVTNVRTFTSTEAQTDDFGDVPGPGAAPRRRERRERRQQRRLGAAPGAVPPPLADGPPPPPGDRLPDLLHSHLPPPYSTLPLPPQQPPPPPHHPPPPPAVSGMRFPFQISPAGARSLLGACGQARVPYQCNSRWCAAPARTGVRAATVPEAEAALPGMPGPAAGLKATHSPPGNAAAVPRYSLPRRSPALRKPGSAARNSSSLRGR
ncbi:nascent polypeptide-associated complex subunit alpha, muscle-specific form-like [Schistocerca americana]|uniref:nascent polypeptide-associated complex subunit alpha, muscle-specific form-like n=1 Tax=Schistocerca americana TaxID=7009 RepID=UPI001F4F480A|nr:nascent polypeptide-associated complex subunit alpha, muscle-specific form-like [Schistocerca americana]